MEGFVAPGYASVRQNKVGDDAECEGSGNLSKTSKFSLKRCLMLTLWKQ
jgi:hypothetical protein